MSTWRFLIVVTLTAMLALVVGCSGGSTPVAPENNAGSLDSLPIIGLTEAGDAFNAVGLLGAYELTINPEDMSVDLIAKRTPTIGESYIVSGLGFFTVSPCSDCLKLAGFAFDMTSLTLAFDISHPFDPGNPSEPPTALNRNDLSVFDLAAVIHPNDFLPVTYALTGQDVYTGVCMDPAGYTPELALMLNDPAALPYFLVVDDSIDQDPPSSTWNKFAQGGSDNFEVKFDLTAGILTFDMYLTMGYGASAKKAQRLTPKYFNPEFNRKAAWKVEVTPPQGDLPPEMGNTWQDNDSTTQYGVTVEVWDWQSGATVTGDPATYADGPESDVYAASEVEKVTAEVPGMTSTLPEATTPDSGSGLDPADPLIYTVPFPNENLLPVGEYLGLVKVLDNRAPGTIGDRDFGIDSPDGVALINFALPEFATYQTFIATVVLGCGPITGQVDDPNCPVTGLATGAIVPFTVSASSGNGGDPIVLYEMDMDYDGSTFDIDDSNATGLFSAGPFTPPDPCNDNIPYTWTVAFRATDSCDPPNVTIFATCDVTVEICCSDQTLSWDFASCTSVTYNCAGWACGGCGLPNNDQYSWGRFKFGCTCSNAQNNCSDITWGYISSGGDSGSCYYMCDHYNSANFNVVSPSVTLPASSDGVFHFDHCNSWNGGSCTVYISESDCNGPWQSLGTTPSSNGCHMDSSFDISGYSGTNVMFRINYVSSSYCYSCGSCSNSGMVIDNPTIEGCFAGDLVQN